MKLTKYLNPQEALKKLSLRGFKEEFKLNHKGLLTNDLGMTYSTLDIEINEFHRFDEDGLIVIAISPVVENQRKGRLAVKFEELMPIDLIKFMSKAKIKTKRVEVGMV